MDGQVSTGRVFGVILYQCNILSGSFLEFLPILSILRKEHDASSLPYHLIVPSMPGYTFSSPPPLDRDLRIEDIARIFDKLMIGLGFADGYVVQGGDIGSKVGRVMAAKHASCKGNRQILALFCATSWLTAL
jgi:pimeloyl-ACP methyl ester carboxylesterase